MSLQLQTMRIDHISRLISSSTEVQIGLPHLCINHNVTARHQSCRSTQPLTRSLNSRAGWTIEGPRPNSSRPAEPTKTNHRDHRIDQGVLNSSSPPLLFPAPILLPAALLRLSGLEDATRPMSTADRKMLTINKPKQQCQLDSSRASDTEDSSHVVWLVNHSDLHYDINVSSSLDFHCPTDRNSQPNRNIRFTTA
jgi:hypothetical protein